ncbi:MULTISPECIES: hypothetical protein [unclassified Mameliella]|uniref:hypothetical protein n=1 Tax=unclassified Mameliella TaxID=2630630 RepID=UPI00273D193F|nr:MULTISPECIES: hypothetical protein [unclassified Mameliella]
MNWDLILFILDAPPPAVSDLPGDWTPGSFETETIRRTVSATFPETDWSDPS